MASQIGELFGGELKHEIFRETFRIALNRLVKRFGFHPIEFGEISIQHDLLPAKEEDFCFDTLYSNKRAFASHTVVPFPRRLSCSCANPNRFRRVNGLAYSVHASLECQSDSS